ncbi:Uu.00g108230.m01.CDS01 [Anthostomella pinea]|uniref:Uu.00g108230.m01.CDS01 n=1 Tax=Anthostomella pinea TaxID=933095 RepID=A0AAI8VF62_9PEZI|nr:Uu.00g108230.m01.CDS01 [Anthostomella pinea]
MADQEPLKGFSSLTTSTHTTPSGSLLSFSHTPASQHKPGAPILLLLHGWPQSRYMWRYAIPPLAEKGYTLFVPDLPGYGDSTLATKAGASGSKHDRATVGESLLSAVRSVYAPDNTPSSATAAEETELNIILVGHDRGARVSQRLSTTPPPPDLNTNTKIRILGTMLIDIVPYTTQWANAAANPRAATSYFHWSFLPNAALSSAMIKAYGGARFCRAMMARSTGTNAPGVESLHADGAVDRYAELYEREAVIEGASADYAAGAAEDWEAERGDREAGRGMGGLVYVVYSEGFLGRVHGASEEIWKGFVGDGGRLETHGVGEGFGHYLPEEAPEVVNGHIGRFLGELGV